jgi:hypothetical protein
MKMNNLKPLVFALAAALSPVVAQAAVTANQLPGDGTVLYGSASASVNGSAITINVTGTANNGVAIVAWGNSGGTINPNAATGGFNIGSQASVTFDNGTGGTAPFVLNVDTTSDPTEIAGAMSGNGVNMGIANANGIMVDGSAVINAPDGLALMNQGYTSGDLAKESVSPGIVFDFANATGGVTIATGASVNLGGYVFIAGAGNINIDAPLVDSAASNNILSIYGASGASGNIDAPVKTLNNTATSSNLVVGNDGGSTNLNIGSTGTIQAGYLTIGQDVNPAGGSVVGDFPSLSVINIVDNGSIIATNTGNAGEVQLGYLNEINGSSITQAGSMGLPAGTVVEAIGSVSGSGYIQGNVVGFLNQVGPVNNNTTGQILANGFQIKAGNSGTAAVFLTPGWASASGFNIQIAGNGSLNTSYQTPSFTGNGSVNLTPQADNASRLIVQATGTLLVRNADGGAVSAVTLPGASASTPAIVFPGLVYLAGDQGLTVNNPIDTAYSTSTPVGYGVFLLGPTVTDGNAIIANGDRGINIESTSYGPTTINGVNVTQGQPPLPSFYFLASSNGALNLTAPTSFSNEWSWNQPNQVFFVSPQFTGNSYPS